MTQKVYRLINASLSSGNGSTSKVKISSADDVENYLDLKIAVQDGVTKEITNPAANEVLTLGLDPAQVDHNSLQNYNIDEHRPVDDTQTTDENIWSAEKVSNELANTLDAANTYTDDAIAPIEDRDNVLTVYAYENNSQVYADGQPGVKDPSALIRDGWYFKNSIASQKINWYYFDGTSQGTVTLGDFKSAYAVMTFDAVSGAAAPIIAIYTFPTGTGDVIPGFAHSRIIYDGPTTPTPVVGKQYLVYAGENPPVHPELPRINLALIPGLSIGDKLPTEQIFTISFGSSSGAAVNQIQYMVETLGLFSDPVKHEMDLRIRVASQLDLTTHVTDTNNPHSVTKDQVGLGNVDNTSDLDKPISDDTQDALDLKVAKAGDTMTGNLNILPVVDESESTLSHTSALFIQKDAGDIVAEGSYTANGFVVTTFDPITSDVLTVATLAEGKLELVDGNGDAILPATDADVAVKKYVDDSDATKVAKAGDTMTDTLEINPPIYDLALKIDSTPSTSASIEIRGLAAPFEISEAGGELTANSFLSATNVSFDKYTNIGEYEQYGSYGFTGLYLEKYDISTEQLERETQVNFQEITLKTFDGHPSGNPSNYIEAKDGQVTLQTRIGGTLFPSTPISPSHATPKNYVDTAIGNVISTITSRMRMPQAVYVNNNPSHSGYIANGSIQNPYQTIKAALDSIVDASSAKRYCIVIAPGTYNELNTIRLKGFVDLISIANDTVIINAGGSRLLWSNNSPGRVFITDISISHGVEVLNDDPTGTSGCVLDLDNVDTGTVIFNGRGGGRDFIQLRNDTRLSGSCTINSAATTIFDSTIIGNVNLTDIGCVAPDGFGSAITATLRSNYQLNVNITSTNFDIYVDAWGNNNVSTLTMTSNSAVPSTFNSDAVSYPNTITLSGSPSPVVARTTQARAVSVNPVSGIVSTDVQSALEELKNQITSVDLSVSSEPTGFLDASQTTISFSDSTPDRTFTIAPVSSSFIFYANGEMFTKTTAQVVQIPNNEGNHYIYFDTDGVLKSTQVFDDSIILTKAFVSVVYWDVDNQKHVYFANERHGLVMDGQTHIHFHTVFGAQYISGLALQNFTIGNGNSNADAQYTADEGTIRDEDIKIVISAQSQIPTLYRLGAAGNWRRKEVDSFPFIYSGTEGYVGADGRLPFNEFTGGVWQLSQIANNGFVLIHYFATNDIEYPIVAIQGQAQYGTIVDARISANSEISQLSGLPFAEFVAIGSVILQSADGYTNTVKARVRLTDTGSNYVDFRGSQILVAAATANDHGLLSGLDSDDHIQYHTDSRADTWFSGKTTDDLAQGTNNLYLDIPDLATPSGLDVANDDLVIYSSLDSAHRKIKLNQLTSVVGSAGDIAETSASFLNNISTPTNVVGLAFATAVVSSFEAQVVVSRGTKKEVFTLLGVQIDGDFSMSVESVGVDTGVDFTITDLGQVQYTSTDAIDGGTIKFRAITLTV